MREIKEWTLMFFFASDNPLAISIVSQLKALKAAGFHPDANVVAQFDPFTEGTPTHIFDVNVVNKKKSDGEPQIGFAGNVSLVRDLIEDKLWKDQKTRDDVPVRDALRKEFEREYGFTYDAPIAPTNGLPTRGRNGELKEPGPQESLTKFLTFCRKEYPARHYMLFILGHGVVVGNDIFLLDEHADEHSLTLAQMGDILRQFSRDIKHRKKDKSGKLELVGFHSCSVSSLEVVHELARTANYMLASQGPSFVGSWPYRQILMRIFEDVDGTNSPESIRKLVTDLFYYCLYSSEDFLLAGYSYQLTLCDLTKASGMKAPLAKLSKALIAGLNDPVSKDAILLSHLKSQSFFHEMYTDLYDFCFCLQDRYKQLKQAKKKKLGLVTRRFEAIADACDAVMEKLKKSDWKRVQGRNQERSGEFVEGQLVVASEFAGPAYQYSRGLSIYFPWTRPTNDDEIRQQYKKYKINATRKELGKPWLEFLREYFDKTLRVPACEEKDTRRRQPRLTRLQKLQEDLASLVYNGEGSLSAANALGNKGDPSDRTGGDLDEVRIKNYPMDVRPRRKRRPEKSRLWGETFCVRQDLRRL